MLYTDLLKNIGACISLNVYISFFKKKKKFCLKISTGM